ncbi:hypothetical protein B0H14DRAFT_3437852 [Mycena olivaceomarginata]|nr:hypothetical protein B0H14DRAFT_3437852 [Mycena olivaceomarginata]
MPTYLILKQDLDEALEPPTTPIDATWGLKASTATSDREGESLDPPFYFRLCTIAQRIGCPSSQPRFVLDNNADIPSLKMDRSISISEIAPGIAVFRFYHLLTLDKVTYRYILHRHASFLNEEYAKSSPRILSPPRTRTKRASSLIPLRILCGHLPPDELMHRFPSLADIFALFVAAICTGDIAGFDRALEQREDSDASRSFLKCMFYDRIMQVAAMEILHPFMLMVVLAVAKPMSSTLGIMRVVNLFAALADFVHQIAARLARRCDNFMAITRNAGMPSLPSSST